MRLLRWTRRVSELCQLLAIERCVGEGFETSFSQKEIRINVWDVTVTRRGILDWFSVALHLKSWSVYVWVFWSFSLSIYVDHLMKVITSLNPKKNRNYCDQFRTEVTSTLRLLNPLVPTTTQKRRFSCVLRVRFRRRWISAEILRCSPGSVHHRKAHDFLYL